MPDIRQINECPDCASSNIVHSLEREQIICRECGLIYEPLTPTEETRFKQAHGLMTKPARKIKAKPKAKAKKRRKR